MNKLYEKMSLEKNDSIVVLNKPDDVDALDELEYKTKLNKKQGAILIFIKNLKEMKDMIYNVEDKKLLEHEGYLYFMYPKLNNKKGLDPIHRDDIFPYLNLDMGGDGFVDKTNLKFSRMVKFDDNYTTVGLKYFESRPRERKVISQSVGDYKHHIPEIMDTLKDDDVTYTFFKNLTPGKQRDWARNIFSAQREETRNKRWESLKDAARKG